MVAHVYSGQLTFINSSPFFFEVSLVEVNSQLNCSFKMLFFCHNKPQVLMRKSNHGCSDFLKSSAGTVSPPFHTARQAGLIFHSLHKMHKEFLLAST